MNNSQMSVRVGLFFLLGVALILVTFETLSRGTITRESGYTLVARFSNLKELKAGDDVRMAGVRIGTVAETRLAGRGAEAVLLIARDVVVSKDSLATIAMAGLLGGNYVTLDIGQEGSGVLADGERIETADTADFNSMVAQLGEIGRKVDQALSQFSGAMEGGTGGGFMAKLDRMIDDNQSRIGDITTDLQEITNKVNNGQGSLGKLVNDPEAYERLLAAAEEFRGASAEARLFVSNAQGILEQVKRGEGTLGALIYDQQSGEDIKAVAKNLREISDKLNNGSGTLGKLINDDSLIEEAQSTLRKVDRAVDGLADQGPITAVGAAASALF
jgi:phospholipid/cholesterol/gamma-HCH transport system substrate-binding protein